MSVKLIHFIIVFFAFNLCFNNETISQTISANDLFFKTLKAIENAKTMSYSLEMKERIHGKMQFDHYTVKLQVKPFKVYTYSYAPNPGAEALYIEGANNNKVLVKPNSFPYVNLNLNPMSMILRKNHQFYILQSGFMYTHNVLMQSYITRKEEFLKCLKLDKDVYWDSKNCYQLILDYQYFTWINYTVKKGETLTTIAERNYINDYMILERNNLKSFEDVKAGQVIKIPNVFCKKYVMYIDKITLLPLVQIIYDDKGLYCHIEYHNFKLNPAFTEMDFSKDNKAYGF